MSWIILSRPPLIFYRQTPTLVLIEAVILATCSLLAQHNRSRRPPLSALTTQQHACSSSSPSRHSSGYWVTANNSSNMDMHRYSMKPAHEQTR
ncbi:hypothetical protein RB213_012904 [Colletotrichum asianum]